MDKKFKNNSIMFFLVTLLGINSTIMISTMPYKIQVQGTSMEPTIKDGRIVSVTPINVIDRFRFTIDKNIINTGDIVVFSESKNQSEYIRIEDNINYNKLIKRVWGMPGNKIRIDNGELFVNDRITGVKNILPEFLQVDLLEDEYFVLGDNLNYSVDSRTFGPIKFNKIIGMIKK